MFDCLRVTCHLSSPIAGDIPMLDSILEYEIAQRLGMNRPIQRTDPAPRSGAIPIPIARRWIGGLLVPCCSSPIVDPCLESVERFTKRLSTENSDMLSDGSRKMVPIGNGLFKSYRLPLRLRLASRVVWFTIGKRKPCLNVLKSVVSLGKKRSQGYGRVQKWEAESASEDHSWFAVTDLGSMLMRPLPNCDGLPVDMIGYRADFGAAQPPYWHPDRFIERVVPA